MKDEKILRKENEEFIFTNAFKKFLGTNNYLVTNSDSSMNFIAILSLCSKQLIIIF